MNEDAIFCSQYFWVECTDFPGNVLIISCFESPIYGKKQHACLLMIMDFLHGTQKKHCFSSQVRCFIDFFPVVGEKKGRIRENAGRCLQIVTQIL